MLSLVAIEEREKGVKNRIHEKRKKRSNSLKLKGEAKRVEPGSTKRLELIKIGANKTEKER